MVIGIDGFAMLALSFGVMLLSLGASPVLAFCYVLWIASHAPHDAPPNQRIVVLGTRLDSNGEPNSRYRARLDRVCQLWGRTADCEVIILGGSTSQDARSEAAVGAAFLRARGVPGDRIRTEDRSRHTLENLLLYRAQFPATMGEPPVLVTSRFHLARSSLLALGLGIAHTRCAAEDSRLAALRDLPRMAAEALLIHWYVTGRSFARLTGSKRIAARIM